MNDRFRQALERIANSPSIGITPEADALRLIAREALAAPADVVPLPCIKCDRHAITNGYCEECALECRLWFRMRLKNLRSGRC